MWTYLLTRVLQALFTLWVVSVLVFFAARLTGSPDLALLPPDALPEQRQAFKQAYGLDQPVLVQYWRWISRAVQGDLGQGIQHKIAVRELIGPRLVNSLKLATVAITLAVCLAVPLGVVAAVQRGRLWDRIAMSVGLGGQSMPSFWLALMLVLVFAVWLRALPATGMGTWKHFILPGITMGWFISAGIIRLVRSSMLEVLDAEFVPPRLGAHLGAELRCARPEMRPENERDDECDDRGNPLPRQVRGSRSLTSERPVA